MPPQQQVFSDRYELVRHVARGGMAQVYLARDLLLDRQVALKVLFPELSVDPSFVERFRAEAKAAANLSHPNIVAVYDWGQGERTYYIVMEYIDGSTLSQQIRTAPLDPRRAAEVGSEVAAALAFAHRRGVIHRDVKPGNVLIDQTGQVKVADFGIARAVGATEGLTQTGAVMGTATYFSPEQAQGLPVDARSDVYSLGVVLYEMVAGRAPFTGDNPVAIAYKHVREQPEPLAALRPDVPPPYAAIVAQAMAKDPAARYDTAADLRADLLRFSAGQAVAAVDPTVASSAAAPTMVGVAVTPPRPGGAVTGGAADATTVVGGGAAGASGGGAGRGGVGVGGVAGGAGAAGGSYGAPGDDAEAARRAAARAAAERDAARSRRTTVFVVAVVALLVAVGVVVGVFGRTLGIYGSTSKTLPSDLVGEPVATAESQLHGLGFTNVDTTTATSETVSAGDVISTTPAVGSEVSTSSAITLTVSTGAGSVTIPDVAGESQATATAALRAAGFVVTVGSAQSSDSVAAGHVISTSPPVGQSAPKGSAVRLILSSGHQTVAIPSLAGTDSATAANELGQLGFTIKVQPETSAEYAAGDVTRTAPQAGEQEPVGSTVVLYVSEGAQVPKVVGLDPVTAAADLATAGLDEAVQDQPATDPAQVGEVLSQSPAAGTDVAPGTTVTLVVGTAPTTTTSSTTSTSTTTPTVTAPSTTPAPTSAVPSTVP